MGRTCGTYGGEKTCKFLVGKPEGKRSVGRLRLTLEDNIQIYKFLKRRMWGVEAYKRRSGNALSTKDDP
jgi:hypothetical protein